jgi:hypothetical protein
MESEFGKSRAYAFLVVAGIAAAGLGFVGATSTREATATSNPADYANCKRKTRTPVPGRPLPRDYCEIMYLPLQASAENLKR